MKLSFALFFAGFVAVSAACSREPSPPVAQTPKVVASPIATPLPSSSVVPPAPTSPFAAEDAGDATPSPAASETAEVVAPTDQEEVTAIREATFRYMFGKNASGIQQNAGVYCLKLEKDADPPSAFIARFHDVKIPVKPASACDASAGRGVIDKATKKHGLVFRVDSVVVAKDGKHATVQGGYYEAGLSASGNVYTLEKKATRWIVVKDQMTWIS